MVMKIIAGTPTYVWFLLVFLVFNGYQSCFTRTRSLFRLTLIPAVFLWLETSSVRDLFGITLPHVLASAAGLLLGLALGFAVTRRKSVLADKAKWLVQLPGDLVTLTIIALNFPYQYALHVAFHICPAIPHLVRGGSLVLMGAFTGISLGRNSTFLYKYFRAPNTALA